MNGRKILIVDDEPIARDNLAHIITKDGYQARVAEDGEQAIALLGKEEVNLVLTDLCMQGKDGMAVLDAAKRLWPDIEVVVITGHATVDTAVEAMRHGAYDYVAKPFKISWTGAATVVGYFLVGAVSGTLYWAERLYAGAGQVFANGDSLTVTPRITFASVTND